MIDLGGDQNDTRQRKKSSHDLNAVQRLPIVIVIEAEGGPLGSDMIDRTTLTVTLARNRMVGDKAGIMILHISDIKSPLPVPNHVSYLAVSPVREVVALTVDHRVHPKRKEYEITIHLIQKTKEGANTKHTVTTTKHSPWISNSNYFLTIF